MSKLFLGRNGTTPNIVDNTTLTTNACMAMPHNKYIFVLTTPMNTSAIVVHTAIAAASILNRHACDHIYAIIAIIVGGCSATAADCAVGAFADTTTKHKCICKHIGAIIVDAAVYSNGSFNTYYRYGPHFEDIPAIGNVTNITVPIGNAVYLNCRISLLQDKTVRILNVP